MSLLRRLQRFSRHHLLGGAGRAAASALLLSTGLAAPGAAPILAALAAPAAVAPLAPHSCSTLVTNLLDNGSANTLRSDVAYATHPHSRL
jgi:hypothetical protein